MSSTKGPRVDDRDIDQATREGREEAQQPYASAVIPTKYWNKKELGDAWYTGFMEEIKCK